MPDMMSLHQPHHNSMLLSPIKESPRHCDRFPEYLKNTDVLGDANHKLKLTASNSLFHAVLKGRVRGTRLLLDRGTSVNSRNDYGYSVLTAALHIDEDKRRNKLFRLLLDRGADPRFKDSTYDRSVLHWACVLGRTEQVKALLKEVAGDINLQEKDNEGHTALHYAVMAGHMDIVVALVDMHRKFGVSVDVADKMGLTPYLHAKRLGYRDAAEYLHNEGLASQGHGDILFRTPREWSQIGKFERQKAIETHTQEAINMAKIRGKITRVRHLEDILTTPRMGIPSSQLPSHSLGRDPGVKRVARANDRLSTSLPSLQEHTPRGEQRPFSANGAGLDAVDAAPDNAPNATNAPNAPKPPREAFANEPGPGQNAGGQQGPAQTVRPPGPLGGIPHGSVPGAPWHGAVPTRKGPGSNEAFTLLEMNEKGRHARSYRQSQFDETKASEYKHMLGNLNSIMDILSQQQSKSFRKSVKYQRPETPKKKKTKSKVSSLAVIFGRDKSGRRSKKRSPKPSAKKGSSSARKEKAAGEEKKGKAASEKRKAVPQLKVNDKAV